MKKIFMVAVIAIAMFANLNANGQSVGQTFSVSGVTYKITSLSPNEVQLGSGNTDAFATNPQGSYTILDSVTGGTNNLTYSVTSIGAYAFYNYSGLTSITISNSVTSIGNGVFSYCSGLTSVTIPNSVTSIGNQAFSGCSGLTGTLTIPNSVTSIGNYAFSSCSGLTSVTWNAVNCTLPTTYSYSPFYNNTSITNVIIGDSVQVIPNYLFYGCSGITGTLTIPNSVTSIGNSAFYNCSGLTSVTWNAVNCTLPTSSPNSPFYNNTSITNVTIGDSVQVIPNHLFSGCSGITGTLTIPNLVTSIGNGVFAFCSGLTSVTIPNSVTSIGSAAFYSCSGLTSVTIPNSVTSIDYWAFYNCSGLTSVTWNAVNCTLPTSYSDSPFYNKTSITNVTIGDSVQVIPNYLFYGCSGIIGTLTIPNSVTSIGNYAFQNCSGLTEITILAVTPPYLGNTCFGNVPTTILVHVPCESVSAYQSATDCSYFTNYTGFTDTTFINASICYGETYTQNGFNENTAGQYTRTEQNVNGCDSTITLNLTVYPQVQTNTINVAICYGETYNLNGFNENTAGQYTRTEQNVNGCDSTITLNLVVNPVYNDTINAEITEGETYNLNGFNESTAGTYTQTLQSVNGCDSIVVLNLSVTNSLNDIAETASISLYPNPASETINITCGEKINSIEVVDLLGKVVYQGKETTIDVSAFAKGNYFVRVQTDNGTITKKVVVQ